MQFISRSLTLILLVARAKGRLRPCSVLFYVYVGGNIDCLIEGSAGGRMEENQNLCFEIFIFLGVDWNPKFLPISWPPPTYKLDASRRRNRKLQNTSKLFVVTVSGRGERIRMVPASATSS